MSVVVVLFVVMGTICETRDVCSICCVVSVSCGVASAICDACTVNVNGCAIWTAIWGACGGSSKLCYKMRGRSEGFSSYGGPKLEIVPSKMKDNWKLIEHWPCFKVDMPSPVLILSQL